MLTNIENRLEELFEEIESLPPEKVEAAEKVSTFHDQLQDTCYERLKRKNVDFVKEKRSLQNNAYTKRRD